MKKLAITGAVLLGAACGGKSGGSTIGGRGGAPRGPVLVFVGLDQTMMFEAACHAPAGGPDCDAQRAAAMDGKQQVSSDGSTFRITGTVSDNCDASGATDVVGLEKLSGPEDVAPGVVTYPDGAAIDLQVHSGVSADGVTVAADVRAALARVANAGMNKEQSENARTVTAGEIIIEQLVETNVDGDPKADLLIAANVPLGEDTGPGYVWSALVLLPGGDPAAATTLWVSDLEHLWIDASFDLEGDGRRELIYSAEYYEGGGHGAATIKDGKLEILGQWRCGA